MKVIKTLEDYQAAIKERIGLGDLLIRYPDRKEALEQKELLDLLLEAYRKEHPVVDARPCPWRCGFGHLRIGLHRIHGYFVSCGKCKGSGPYGKDQDEAVRLWNERE